MKGLDRAQLDSLFAAAAKESAEDALMLRVDTQRGCVRIVTVQQYA